MVLFYVYDEYTDVEDGSGAGIIAGIVMDAIRNPEKARPVGEFPVGELARQYVIFPFLVFQMTYFLGVSNIRASLTPCDPI